MVKRDMVRVFLGHHFYGAGNFGDDLILAGFLHSLRSQMHDMQLCCSIPHARESQQRRFPGIRWIPYNIEERREAIRGSKVWVGVGGSPFQSDDGDWFITHLVEDARICAEFGVPMYFLGVGVNNADVLSRPEVRSILAQARHIWARDRRSFELLVESGVPSQAVALGADLSHVYLASRPRIARIDEALSYCLNFHSDLAPIVPEVERWVREAGSSRQHWLVQEVRELPRAEQVLFSRLSPEAQVILHRSVPDYDAAGLESLLEAWPICTHGITCRYHATIIQGWNGTRLGVVAINDKLTAIAEELDLPQFRSVSEFSPLHHKDTLRSANREVLEALASRAYGSVLSWLRMIHAAESTYDSASRRVHLKPLNNRIGVVCPDSLGDLVLRQPLISELINSGYRVDVIARPEILRLLPFVDPRASQIPIHCNPYVKPTPEERGRLKELVVQVGKSGIGAFVLPAYNATLIEGALTTELPNIPVLRFANRLPAAIPYDSAEVQTLWAEPPAPPVEVPVEHELHELRKYEALLLEGLGLMQHRAPRLSISSKIIDEAREVRRRLGISTHRYAVSCPVGAANVAIKGLPENLLSIAARRLAETASMPLLLVGSHSEKRRIDELRQNLQDDGRDVFSWTGSPDELPTLLGLLAEAALYVGPDTGPMHMAAALGVPVTAVMGGGTYPRFLPCSQKSLVVTEQLPCFGCGWACIFEKARCLHSIPPETFEKSFGQFVASITTGNGTA